MRLAILKTITAHKSLAHSRTVSAAEYASSVPDSLKYYTSKNRVVYGGGGILPDYIVPLDTLTSKVAGAVIGGSLDQLFAREWFETHEQEYRDAWGERRAEFIGSYQLEPEVWNAFWEFAKDKGLKLSDDAALAETEDDVFTYADVESQRQTFEIRIKALLARQLYGRGVWHPIVNTIDPELTEALNLWNLAEELAVVNR